MFLKKIGIVSVCSIFVLGNYSFCSKKNSFNTFGNGKLNLTQKVQGTPNAKKPDSNIKGLKTLGSKTVLKGQGSDRKSVNSDLQSISSPFFTDNESIGSSNSNLSNDIPKPDFKSIHDSGNEKSNESGFSTPKKNQSISPKKNINGSSSSPSSPKVVDIIQKEFLFGEQEVFNRVKYFYSKNSESTLLKSLYDAYERGFRNHCSYVDEELNPTPTKVPERMVLGKDGTPKKVKAHVAQKLPNEFYTKKNSDELIEEWNQHGLKSMMTELQSTARKIQDIIRDYEKTENNSDTIVDLAILGLLGVNYLFKDYNGFSILQYAGNQARCYLFPFAVSMAQLQFPEVSVYNELNFDWLSESAQKLYKSMSKQNSILEKYSNVLFRSNKSIDHFGEAGLIKTLQDNGHANGRKFFGILKNIFEIAEKSKLDIDDGLLSGFNIDEQIELLSERTGGFDLCIQNTNDQLMNQIKSLQQEVDSKNTLLIEIQKQIDSSKSFANEALDQVTSLEENNINLKNELKTLAKKNNEMIQENEELKIQMKSQIDEIKSQAKSQINQIRNQAKTALSKLQNDYNQQILQVNNELENSKTQNQQLISKTKDLETQSEQLNSDILSKENLNSELQNTLNSLNEEIKSIKTDMIAKDQELQAKVQELNSLAEQIELANQKNIELSNSLSEKGNEINQVKNQAKDALSKLQNDYNQQISQINQALENSKTQNTKLISQTKDLQAQIQGFRQQNENIFSENQSLNTQVENLNNTLQAKVQELNSLREQIASVNQENSELSNSLSEKEAEIEQIRNQAKELQTQNEKLKAQSTTQINEIRSKAETEINQVKSQLGSEINKVRNQATDLQTQIQGFQQQNGSIFSENQILNTQLEDLNNKLQAKTQELISLTGQIELANQKNSELSNLLSEKETEIEQVKIQMGSEINKVRNQTETEINQVKNQATELETQIQGFQQQNENISTQNKSLTQQLNQVRSEKDRLQNNILGLNRQFLALQESNRAEEEKNSLLKKYVIAGVTSVAVGMISYIVYQFISKRSLASQLANIANENADLLNRINILENAPKVIETITETVTQKVVETRSSFGGFLKGIVIGTATFFAGAKFGLLKSIGIKG